MGVPTHEGGGRAGERSGSLLEVGFNKIALLEELVYCVCVIEVIAQTESVHTCTVM